MCAFVGIFGRGFVSVFVSGCKCVCECGGWSVFDWVGEVED